MTYDLEALIQLRDAIITKATRAQAQGKHYCGIQHTKASPRYRLLFTDWSRQYHETCSDFGADLRPPDWTDNIMDRMAFLGIIHRPALDALWESGRI